MPILNAIMGSPILSKIGSTKNGTVRNGEFLAVIKIGCTFALANTK